MCLALRAFVFGHPFQLVTDHKPLLSLFGGSAASSAQVCARVKRWSLFLSSYEYEMEFRKTTDQQPILQDHLKIVCF